MALLTLFFCKVRLFKNNIENESCDILKSNSKSSSQQLFKIPIKVAAQELEVDGVEFISTFYIYTTKSQKYVSIPIKLQLSLHITSAFQEDIRGCIVPLSVVTQSNPRNHGNSVRQQ